MVRDGQAYLNVPDPDVWAAIVEATSYKLEGAEYQRRGRDPRTKLVRNNKCPLGLLDRVCRVASNAGAQVTLDWADEWHRPKPERTMHLYDATPRDYQQEAELVAVLNDRGILRAPTGSGKTLMGAMMIAARRMHAVVIVPTIDLMYQFKRDLEQHLWVERNAVERYPIGQLGDGKIDPRPVSVATIRTIAKVVGVAYQTYEYGEYDDKDDTAVNPAALRQWVDDLGLVLVDEAHILGAQTIYDVVSRIPAPCKFGLSASPWRDDGADLQIEAATGPLIYRVPVDRLVEQGYIMAPEIVVKDTSSWWQSAAWGRVCTACGRQSLKWTPQCECGCREFRSQFNEAYKTEIVNNPVRNAMIAKTVQALGCPTLTLVKQVKHGRLLQDLIPGSVFLSGRNKGEDRAAAFQAVRDGESRTLICTTIADMGLDIPNLGALALAGGGKSSTRHLQRIGRVVRSYPGKAQPMVIDFDDGHVHSWFSNHAQRRRKIEREEWGRLATWRNE